MKEFEIFLWNTFSFVLLHSFSLFSSSLPSTSLLQQHSFSFFVAPTLLFPKSAVWRKELVARLAKRSLWRWIVTLPFWAVSPLCLHMTPGISARLLRRFRMSLWQCRISRKKVALLLEVCKRPYRSRVAALRGMNECSVFFCEMLEL